MQYKKFVSRDLTNQLWKEYTDKIHPYIAWFRSAYPNTTPSTVLGYFGGIPADPLRRLFGYLLFQEVFTLLFEKHDSDSALQLVRERRQKDEYYWGNHRLDLLESGRLLPAQCNH